MKKVAQLPEAERKALFSETAAAKGITAAAAEKDFWICWVLLQIFTQPQLCKILRFKGGTTLSKCFGLIERFSEDIDLILDWTKVLEENPEAERSKTQQDKINKKINENAQAYIRETLLPLLQSEMGATCEVNIDSRDANVVNVNYPMVAATSYLRNEIRLEIGALAHMLPFGSYPISSYAAEVFPAVFDLATVSVDAIVPERTFWEKVTILHAEAHRPANKLQPKRYSRHYYDVYKMLGTQVEADALADLALLEDVVAFKQRFYPVAWARYDLATVENIKLIPCSEVVATLKTDYAAMAEMIFGDIPSFESMMEALEAFEQKINAITRASTQE